MSGLSGQATDIDIHAREILRMREITSQLLSKHSGQRLEKVERDVERDFIMNAQQARNTASSTTSFSNISRVTSLSVAHEVQRKKFPALASKVVSDIALTVPCERGELWLNRSHSAAALTRTSRKLPMADSGELLTGAARLLPVRTDGKCGTETKVPARKRASEGVFP